MSKQISAIARLQSLPDVFRGADLTLRFGWTSKTASQYLYLWKRRGLVSALGGHSDVFANRLRAPDPDWGQALRLAMPSVIVIGIEALRQAGWTTQIPARPDVAVDASAPVYTVEPFTVSTRPTQWFENVLKSGLQPRPGLSGLPVLRPAWALADLLATAGWGACGLAPDDIDWEEADAQDRADWDMACAVFGFRPASTDFP